MADFEDSVFGLFYNRRVKETFLEILAHEGWKYFSLVDLNKLFSIMMEKYGINENEISDEEPSDEEVDRKDDWKSFTGEIAIENLDKIKQQQ